jgi:hypothetical protein
MTVNTPSSTLEITRREALSAAWGACVVASGLQSAMAQEGATVRMQLAWQNAADYLSDRWGSLAFLDPERGTGDASTP